MIFEHSAHVSLEKDSVGKVCKQEDLSRDAQHLSLKKGVAEHYCSLQRSGWSKETVRRADADCPTCAPSLGDLL